MKFLYKLKEAGLWLFTSLAEIVAIAVFAAVAIVVLAGSFFWFMLPWHQRKVQAEVDRRMAKARADELRQRVAEEKARRDTEAAYKEAAIKAASAKALEADTVATANEIIGGK